MRYIFFVLLFLVMLDVFSQKKFLETNKFCSFSFDRNLIPCAGIIGFPYEEVSDSDTLKKSINKVLELKAVQQKITLGVMDHPTLIGMYCKLSDDLQTRIIINQKYIGNYWVAMGIIMHELGHLLKHHENLCSNIVLETEADLFAGNALAMLNADKESALSCLSLISTDENNNNRYPPINDRKITYIKGYESFIFSSNPELSYTSINPIIRWKKRPDKRTEISIDGQKFIIPTYQYLARFDGGEIDPPYGILYLEKTKAVYQLLEYAIGDKGIGELVNDRSTLTYLRTSERTYKFFDKATIIKRRAVYDDIKDGNGIDYEVHFKAYETDEIRRIAFLNYFYTPINRLMPALIK